MTKPRSVRPQPIRIVMPGWAWALVCGLLSLTWFFSSVAAGTSYFDPGNGLPSLTDLQVWGMATLLIAQATALLWADRHPVWAFWSIYGVYLVMIGLVEDRALSTSLTLLFAIVALIARSSGRVWIPTLTVVVIADLVIYLGFAALDGQLTYPDVLIVVHRTAFTFLAPWLGGMLAVALQRQSNLKAERAEAEASAAIAAEHNLMARELHDVTAHHLSALGMVAKAALRARELGEEVTTEHLERIQAAAAQALVNLRDVIRVLRNPGEQAALHVAVPTLGNLPELVAGVRALHPTLDLTVEGDVDDIPAAASFAALRIVQESLTNVRKHAPGAHVAIRLRRDHDELTVEVTNAQSSPSAASGRKERSGFGVLGMRERAELLGGSLDAERTSDGGWRTAATIPLARSKVLL